MLYQPDIQGKIVAASEDIVQLAGRLRLSAVTIREVAKVCPWAVQKMLSVARQADAMAAELDAMSRDATSISLRRRDRRNA